MLLLLFALLWQTVAGQEREEELLKKLDDSMAAAAKEWRPRLLRSLYSYSYGETEAPTPFLGCWRLDFQDPEVITTDGWNQCRNQV